MASEIHDCFTQPIEHCRFETPKFRLILLRTRPAVAVSRKTDCPIRDEACSIWVISTGRQGTEAIA